ncbi:MAG TPA: restriction endonuclease, partial [Burkholderiales bacterium]|nr:restriction endonuclease [Burkholderiales bacterium]
MSAQSSLKSDTRLSAPVARSTGVVPACEGGLRSARFFEKLVLDVLVAMGHGGSLEDAARVLGQTGDGGVDGVIKKDRLGLDVIYAQ